jgi:magnesium transporter
MAVVRWLDGDGATPMELADVPAARAGQRAGFAWVDLTPSDPDEAFHPLDLPDLVVEDLRDDRHQPKVERVGEVVVLIVHGVDVVMLGDELRTVELDLAMADRLLVTWHEQPVASAEAVLRRADLGQLGFERPFDLVHRLLDTMNDVFVPIVEHLDRRLDVIEEDVLSEPTEQTRRDIYALQRDLIQLRRVLVPQAEVVRRLGRERPVGWREGDDALVRDLFDHVNRIAELSASYRALLDSAMDSYRSALDDDLNEMLTTLTVISAVLLPVSVVAGLFGMNFVELPGTSSPDGFWWTLGGCLVLVTAMLGWFVRRGWLGRRAEREAARRRSGLATVLEVPVLGDVLRVPVAGTRAVASATRDLARRATEPLRERDDGR